MNSKLIISGRIKLECRDKEGNLKWTTGWIKNGITNAGKAGVAGRVGNTGSIDPFTYLAVGTSSTAFAASQTALSAEITTNGLERASATVSRVTTTVTDDTLQLTKTWTATATHLVEEIGVFNASSSGVMLARAVTGTETVLSTNDLIATYQIKFA
jgi:hypothetical protein